MGLASFEEQKTENGLSGQDRYNPLPVKLVIPGAI